MSVGQKTLVLVRHTENGSCSDMTKKTTTVVLLPGRTENCDLAHTAWEKTSPSCSDKTENCGPVQKGQKTGPSQIGQKTGHSQIGQS